jgi:hypothetical protein
MRGPNPPIFVEIALARFAPGERPSATVDDLAPAMASDALSAME